MWWDNNGFKAPLVAAERLAKSLDPSFIVVVRVQENIDNYEVFIIHMAGRPLEKVLKKLVEISTKGEAVSNNTKLSFTRDDTWRQITSGEQIDIVVENEIGLYCQKASYYATKEQDIQKSGYGESPIAFQLSVSAHSGEELIEGFLGLRPLTFVGLTGKEERFGFERSISLPSELSTHGTVHINPLSGRPCNIYFKRGRYSLPIIRSGTAYVPAIKIENSSQHILLKSEPFEIHLRHPNSITLRVSNLIKSQRDVRSWIEIFRAMEKMCYNDFCLELFLDDGTKVYGAIAKKPLFPREAADQYNKAITSLRLAGTFLNRVGLQDNKFGIYDIANSFYLIDSCTKIIDDIGTTFTIGIDRITAEIESAIGVRKLGVIVDRLRIGSYWCIFGAIAMMEIQQDEKGTYLVGEVDRCGALERGTDVDVKAFANTLSRDISASFQVIGDGSGTLLQANHSI